MADFAKVGMAVERALGWETGAFMKAYTGNIREQNDEALASCIISEPIIALVKDRGSWEGTAQELLKTLGERVAESTTRQREWPKSPKTISGQLRRITPNLRATGIRVEFLKPHGKRLISLSRDGEQNSVPTVPIVPSTPNGTQGGADGTVPGTQAERKSEERNARNANFPAVEDAAATNADLIAFRRAMYNPEPDGSFVFEGWRANASEVQEETRDSDVEIKALIDRQRNESRGKINQEIQSEHE